MNGGFYSCCHASHNATLSYSLQVILPGAVNSPLRTRVNRLPCMSTLSRSDVANLARLARIEMTDSELDHMATEMDVILNAVARVQEVATPDIRPTSHPVPISNVTRPDVVIPSLTPEQALSGAPAKEDGRFRVPQILGEE